MIEDRTHDSPVSWKRVSALEDARAEPVLEPGQKTAGAADVPATRLAVCPYCRTVWELESIFPEPVKLMICWRCAGEHAKVGLTAPVKAAPEEEAPPEARRMRWKLAGAYAVLVAVGLALGYIASQFWFEEAAPARAVSGQVSGFAAPTTDAGKTEAAPTQEAVLAPPSAGPLQVPRPDATPPTVQPAADQAAPAAPAPPGPVARPRRTPPANPAGVRAATPDAAPARNAEPPPAAQAPQQELTCTQGAAALGLCSAVTTDGRP